MSEPDRLEALRCARDFVRWGASEFNRAGLVFAHGTDNALDEAFHLVLWSLSLPFDLPAVYLEAALTDEERARIAQLLRARIATRKPAAYLTGEAWFAGLPFYVDERVLVPRSPVAELIERDFAPWIDYEPESILDLCTGSGCIGIACAFEYPDAQVDLADIDEGALEIARRNVARHSLDERVSVCSGDLFGAVPDSVYDLIICNPPYVPDAEHAALAQEFQHEPRHALAAGKDGMDIVDRILSEAPDYLTSNGTLICEIGGSRAEFEARFEDLPAAWPEFERGGDGVFIIGREALAQWLSERATAGSDVR